MTKVLLFLQISGQDVQLVICRCCDGVYSLPQTISPSSTASHSLQNMCGWATILRQDNTCSNACQALLCWGNCTPYSGILCTKCVHILDILVHVCTVHAKCSYWIHCLYYLDKTINPFPSPTAQPVPAVISIHHPNNESFQVPYYFQCTCLFDYIDN